MARLVQINFPALRISVNDENGQPTGVVWSAQALLCNNLQGYFGTMKVTEQVRFFDIVDEIMASEDLENEDGSKLLLDQATYDYILELWGDLEMPVNRSVSQVTRALQDAEEVDISATGNKEVCADDPASEDTTPS